MHVSMRQQSTLLWMMEGEKMTLVSLLRISKCVRGLQNAVVFIRFAQMSKAIDNEKHCVKRDNIVDVNGG